MRTSTLRLLVALVGALSLTLASVITAGAYIEQNLVQISLSGPGTVRCDRSATLTARVTNTRNGRPVSNQLVRWSLIRSQSGGDGLSARSTVTNRRGVTSVTLSFGRSAGARTVRATSGRASPSITVRCAGGLPATAAAPAADVEPLRLDLLHTPPAVQEASFDQPTPATGLRLDRLGIDLPLVAGDGVGVPDGAVAHYPGTAWPGQGSNMYVYGHAREGHFLELWQVRTGDRVEVDLADGGVAAYEVTEIHPVVAWDALEFTHPTDGERLTLQTCLTYDDTAPRFVVIAEPVSSA
jgi:LPXTG-site transpeptidase (sortase) family protein